MQNMTGQEQCKTELEATEQDTEPTDDTEQERAHDVFGYKLSKSDGTATKQQHVESVRTEEQDVVQEGHDEVDVNQGVVHGMHSEQCEPSGESSIEEVVESLKQKSSSSKNTGNQQEHCESGCMPSEQLE